MANVESQQIYESGLGSMSLPFSLGEGTFDKKPKPIIYQIIDLIQKGPTDLDSIAKHLYPDLLPEHARKNAIDMVRRIRKIYPNLETKGREKGQKRTYSWNDNPEPKALTVNAPEVVLPQTPYSALSEKVWDKLPVKYGGNMKRHDPFAGK